MTAKGCSAATFSSRGADVYDLHIWNETSGEELDVMGGRLRSFDDVYDAAREMVDGLNEEHLPGSLHVLEEHDGDGELQRYRAEVWQDGLRCLVVR